LKTNKGDYNVRKSIIYPVVLAFAVFVMATEVFAQRCDPTQQEQTDLSGTYTGKAREGDGPAQDATLTITGNSFTLTIGSDTHSGRITAVTTCGYTAVTMMSGDLTPPAPGPNPPGPKMAVSLRARKVGDHLTLTSVPGEPKKVSFTTAGAPRRPRRPRRTPPPPPPEPTPSPSLQQ
jgi:hypothetical protein